MKIKIMFKYLVVIILVLFLVSCADCVKRDSLESIEIMKRFPIGSHVVSLDNGQRGVVLDYIFCSSNPSIRLKIEAISMDRNKELYYVDYYRVHPITLDSIK